MMDLAEEEKDAELERIIQVFSNRNNLQELQAISRVWFEKYFDIGTVVDRYVDMYQKLRFERSWRVFDSCINYLAVRRYLR